MMKASISILAVLALSLAVHSLPTQVMADGKGPQRGQRHLLADPPAAGNGTDGTPKPSVEEAEVINLGGAAITRSFDVTTNPSDEGYKSWVINRNVNENNCVYLCFDALMLRDGTTSSDFLDIYQLNRQSQDQASIDGTIIQDPPGSIEQYATFPNQWKLTTVEACCGPEANSLNQDTLPVYTACSDFPGGGMQLIFSSTTVQLPGPNDSKVSFVVADTLEKLEDMGAFCPQKHVVPVQPDAIVVE